MKILKEYGCTVLITGSKLTDLPALKVADIGIAVGEKCSSTVKNLSDIFLTNNNFNTLLNILEESRKIITTIKEILLYIFLCNLSEIFLITIGIAVEQKPPLTPEGVLWLNVVNAAVFSAILLFEFKAHVFERHKPIMIHRNIIREEIKSTLIVKAGFIAFITAILYHILCWYNSSLAIYSAIYLLSCGQIFSSFLFVGNKNYFFKKGF